jgi:hypothetical protein
MQYYSRIKVSHGFVWNESRGRIFFHLDKSPTTGTATTTWRRRCGILGIIITVLFVAGSVVDNAVRGALCAGETRFGNAIAKEATRTPKVIVVDAIVAANPCLWQRHRFVDPHTTRGRLAERSVSLGRIASSASQTKLGTTTNGVEKSLFRKKNENAKRPEEENGVPRASRAANSLFLSTAGACIFTMCCCLGFKGKRTRVQLLPQHHVVGCVQSKKHIENYWT